MRTSKFTDEQRARLLREADEHVAAENAKKHGISARLPAATSRDFRCCSA